MSNSGDIEEKVTITEYSALGHLYHDKKQAILRLLIDEEMNIKSLVDKTDMNPGTIKRHLDALIQHNLVRLVREAKNTYGQKEKFYRAVARIFEIRIEGQWP